MSRKDEGMIKRIKLGAFKPRVGALIIAVCVLVYTVYHVVSLFGEDITTIATGISTETRVVDGKGYIFRDETPLISEYYGVADYLKADGSKVSVGEELAEVRSGGDASSKNMIAYYDEKIELLQRSVESGYTLADLPEVNGDISEAYYSLAQMLATGETGGISEQTDKLLLSLNCHSLLTDEASPVGDTLERMTEQRENILEAGGKSVVEVSQESGYFYSYTDGFEEQFTTYAADNITADEFYRLTLGDAVADANITARAYGKLARNSEWRFVVRLAEAPSAYFKTGESYELEFVENGNTVIPMTLANSVEDGEYGGKILVFEANRLPDGFTFDRCQSVSVEVSSTTGIYVPKSAVHRMGGSYCVYVLKGSVVTLRRIDVVYETEDYCLAATDVQDDTGVEYLRTNELLIIKGNNLFDGRILD